MTQYIKPRKLVNIRTDIEPHFKKEHVADKKGAPHSFFGRKPPTTSLAYEDLAEGKTGEDVKGKISRATPRPKAIRPNLSL